MFCKSSSSQELTDAAPTPTPRESPLRWDPPPALKNDDPPSDLMELATDLPVRGPPPAPPDSAPLPPAAVVGEPIPTLDVKVIADPGEEVSNLDPAAELGVAGSSTSPPGLLWAPFPPARDPCWWPNEGVPS